MTPFQLYFFTKNAMHLIKLLSEDEEIVLLATIYGHINNFYTGVGGEGETGDPKYIGQD